MKVYCAWHKKYFPDEVDKNGDFYIGEKEPLDNPVRTDGICPRCAPLVKAELELLVKKGGNYEPR